MSPSSVGVVAPQQLDLTDPNILQYKIQADQVNAWIPVAATECIIEGSWLVDCTSTCGVAFLCEIMCNSLLLQSEFGTL